MVPYFIKYILDKDTVTDYLSQKGYYPERIGTKSDVYLCPFHDDTDPSFHVYHTGEYESVYCYGCLFWGDFIDVYANMEKMSLKHAIVTLSKGLKISKEKLVFDINNYIKEVGYKKNIPDINDLIIKINRSCYNYLKMVDFDEEEIKFIDGFYEKILDNSIYNIDVKTLEKMNDMLIDKIFFERKQKYKRKNKFRVKEIEWKIKK